MNKIKDILDYIYYERNKIMIIVIILLILIPFILFITAKKEEPVIIEDNLVKEEVKEEKEEVKSKVIVDIKGEIKAPGCYEVDPDSRVKDVIDLAGGLTDNASTDNINLSSKVYDEMVIVINKKEEVNEPINSSQNIVVSKKEQVKENTNSNSKVSINTAGIEELITLNGIKEARAKKIIEYRETNGPFKSIEEIKNVSGIGEAIFAKIKDYITL